jgi:F-type H+-transporting ATPase subunit b
LLVHLLQSPEFWEGVALVLFFGLLVWLKVPAMAARAIDGHAVKIKDQLAEAENLRKEAERLLASIKEERVKAEKQAEEMLTEAEAQAKLIRAEAKKQLKEQVKRRAEIAQRKIAQAEAQATADVKAAAADLAAEMAEQVLSARIAGKSSDPLVERAIGEIPSKLS